MVAKVGPKDLDVKIKFGGGLHTRASEDEIDPREAADGTNFILDLENRELRSRPPFDLIGTVPNGSEIRGGGSLLKADGTVATFIQAGTDIYEWDGSVDESTDNDEFVKVLLHMNGTDGSTTFEDFNAGGSAHTWTAAGNAQVDTAESKFGGGSYLGDGAGDYISTPDHADFTLGSDPFTIEGWFNCTAAGGTAQGICGQVEVSATAALSSFHVQRTAGNVIQATFFILTGSQTVTGTTQFTDALNTGWHHFAVTRSGTTARLFIDGVQEGSSNSSVGAINGSAEPLVVGRQGSIINQEWTGWLDEFRLSIGVARWTTTFSPPVRQYAGAFTRIATVDSASRLRGHWRYHNWTLDSKLLITDLALVEPVKEWDGTTFQNVTFTDEEDDPFGNFYAKYLVVSNERAIFSHVRDPGQVTPHMIVGSAREDYDLITIENRPSSALSESDPFFLLSPDLRPINGHIEAFGSAIISTEKGQLFHLTGASAQDFAFAEFYAGSAAAGEEAISYIGNDIIYGRAGRIESVRDTDRFGDSEADDLTVGISDQVSSYTGWRIVYNSRLNRAYLFPDGVSECWVYNIAMRGGQLSPWSRWTTSHALAYRPTFVMPMLDPSTGLEYVFMGDSSGNFYRMEGVGASGDAGSEDITVEWLTRLFSAPVDADFFNLEGYIKYRKSLAAEVTMNFEYHGYAASDQEVTITLPAQTGGWHFGGDYYFGGDIYWGLQFGNRLLRQKFQAAGQSSDLQLRLTVTGANAFSINEIGLRFSAASQ